MILLIAIRFSFFFFKEKLINYDKTLNLQRRQRNEMEEYVKGKLDTKVFKRLKRLSGCVNYGDVYETDKGKVFVKCSSESEADVMFRGELISLQEILKSESVKVPEPLFTGNVANEFFLVMEYLDMSPLKKYFSDLGKSLAEMHLCNIKKLQGKKDGFVTGKDTSVIENFGFQVPTACGLLTQSNEWTDDWVSFYARQKLQYQIDLIISNKGNREIIELWSQLQLKIPSFFKDLQILPSLVHGDLWFGNAGETANEPVIYDPAAFFGHHEYDLAIAKMFGGFHKIFYDSYHFLIPQAKGFQQRNKLYTLFHHLNHWNHFDSHSESSLQIMKGLLK